MILLIVVSNQRYKVVVVCKIYSVVKQLLSVVNVCNRLQMEKNVYI